MGILSRSFFSSVLLALNQHLKVPLIDEVELAVVHEGDVGDDARLPKQIPSLVCPAVRGSPHSSTAMLTSRPTLWQSSSSSASLRLRGLLLRRFLRESAGAGGVDALGGGRSFSTP